MPGFQIVLFKMEITFAPEICLDKAIPTKSKSCFGPVKVDIVTQNCTELIRYQKLPRTHHFTTFYEEMLRLSAHFHVSTKVQVIHSKCSQP